MTTSRSNNNGSRQIRDRVIAAHLVRDAVEVHHLRAADLRVGGVHLPAQHLDGVNSSVDGVNSCVDGVHSCVHRVNSCVDGVNSIVYGVNSYLSAEHLVERRRPCEDDGRVRVLDDAATEPADVRADAHRAPRHVRDGHDVL
eukprot:352249-Pyramimonas_sp.AAC.1